MTELVEYRLGPLRIDGPVVDDGDVVVELHGKVVGDPATPAIRTLNVDDWAGPRRPIERLKQLSVKKEPDDPLGLRISIGAGSRSQGGLTTPDEAYLVFRGHPSEVLELLERVAEQARGILPGLAARERGRG